METSVVLDAAGLPELPDNVAALRIEVRGRTITEVSPAMGALVGRAADELVGRRFTELVGAAERAAVERRLDDIVLFGRDGFGSLALAGSEAAASPVWVDVNAHYLYKGGQRIEMAFRRADLAPSIRWARGGNGPPPESAGAVLDSPDDVPDAADDGVASPPDEPEEATPELASVAPLPEAEAETELPVPVELPRAAEEVEVQSPTAIALGCLAASGNAGLVVTRDGRVASATAAVEQVLGTPVARVRGRALADLFDLPPAADEALSAARERRVRQSVLAAVAATGAAVVIEWVPGFESGEGMAVVLPSQGEDPSVQAVMDQSRIVSFVAHDVRESLSAVVCGLRNLARALGPDDTHRVDVEATLRESERASRIVEDILRLVRPGPSRRSPLELGSLLVEAVERFEGRAEEQGLTLEAETAPAMIEADFTSLDRVFSALIENAVHATPKGGQVVVRSRLQERGRPGVVVTVTDTGAGIPDDLLPNVFEPFVTGKPHGTGIGLAYVRRTLLEHRGQIQIESQLGSGTTVTLWFPRLD